MIARKRLREAFAEKEMPVAPGVYDGLTAALTASNGFPAAYMSGAAVASSLGLPDLGLATQTELASRVQLLTGVLGDIPLIADADTGFGDIINVVRTVQLYERAGVSAIQIEDQEMPKKCGHLDSKRVISTAAFCKKIEAAVEARSDSDLVIIARTDSRASLGYEEAVDRVNAYADAGADMIFLEAAQTVDEVLDVPTRVGVPALFNLVPRGKTPDMDLDDLKAAGYGLVIAPGLAFGAAAEAINEALKVLASGNADTGTQWSPTALFNAVGLEYWDGIGARYALEESGA
ncbi:2-methylisocitrate lyase-like PEP mutase family enzyme [Antricoccus suffuscus]|uniref:2-methylisocitrate lyase-like PEP mutase family enzyme n=1 Tax=Antricoccus suffuscus TaxID=1629062 RepID=A0A2T1A0X7_9ACTN|nr:isocitrate lyase/PEP mutase family protein [Antricoccus suffuscus]PRZ42184.1 2-methylisocitrate lyase-like PEP mutase family enzyme [Antricoccus suffuscus]